jgi:hypothetical protein
MKLAAFALVALATTASADPLDGQRFVEGKGFPNVAEVGMPTPQLYKVLGAGHEKPDLPFWYFYDRKDWQLAVIAEMSTANGDFVTRAIEISGTAAPATAKGIRIGDSVATLTKVYGKGEAFSGSVASPMFAKMTSIDLKSGVRHDVPDPNVAFAASVYYPELGTLFVVADGRVDKIVAIPATPSTTGDRVAIIMDETDRYNSELELTLNDMPISRTDPYDYPRSGKPYLAIPSYLLRTGKNTLHVEFTERNPNPKHDLDIRLVELATIDPQVVATTLAHITATKPYSADVTFEVTQRLPHGYDTAKTIKPSDEPALKAAAIALAKQWETKQLTTVFEQNGTDLAKYIRHPKLSLDLRVDQSSMEIFAHGHLARLVWNGTLMPWRFVGGAHDARPGQMGPVDIEMDVWFRLDDKGHFIPVAVFQPGVAPGNL